MSRSTAWTCDRCKQTVDVPYLLLTVHGVAFQVPDPSIIGPRGWMTHFLADEAQDVCPACTTPEDLESAGVPVPDDLDDFEDEL